MLSIVIFPHAPLQTIQTDPEEVPPIMAWEVEAALRKMKNGKEPGKDKVNIETLKAGEETIVKVETTGQASSSSFVYHRIRSLIQSVGAMLWSMAQLRRGHLRMVVYVVGSC